MQDALNEWDTGKDDERVAMTDTSVRWSGAIETAAVLAHSVRAEVQDALTAERNEEVNRILMRVAPPTVPSVKREQKPLPGRPTYSTAWLLRSACRNMTSAAAMDDFEINSMAWDASQIRGFLGWFLVSVTNCRSWLVNVLAKTFQRHECIRLGGGNCRPGATDRRLPVKYYNLARCLGGKMKSTQFDDEGRKNVIVWANVVKNHLK